MSLPFSLQQRVTVADPMPEHEAHRDRQGTVVSMLDAQPGVIVCVNFGTETRPANKWFDEFELAPVAVAVGRPSLVMIGDAP